MENTTSTNVTFGTEETPTNYGHEFKVHYTVGMVIFMPIIISGNTLVLVAIATEKKLQTIPNMFVSSLAVADLLTGLVVIPLYLASFWVDGLDYKDMASCMAKFAMVVIACGASLSSLMGVATDRYIAIVFPYKYLKFVTMQRALIAIIGLWIYIILSSCAPLYGWNKWEINKQCEFYTVNEKSFTVLAVYTTLVISLSATTYMYIHIFIIVYKQQQKMKKILASRTQNLHDQNQNGDNTHSSQNRSESDKKSAKVMAVVYFLFVCFWLPYLSVSPLRYVIEDKNLMVILKNFTLILAMGNSGVNPIVYAWMRSTFWNTFLKILHIKKFEVHPSSE